MVKGDMDSICAIAPTVCEFLGLRHPAASHSRVLEDVVRIRRTRGAEMPAVCLIFSPDAIGTVLIRKHPKIFRRVREIAPLRIDLRSVYPPKTPVCYASMFTGALPGTHGIREYVKRPPAVESVFDVVRDAGKKVAIVAVRESSLDTMFRKTGADHWSEASDKAVTERTLALIEAARHDLVVVYQQEYDDLLHRGTTESPEALEALKRHVGSFDSIARALSQRGRAPYMIAFAPDHGAHLDPVSGKGTHGEDIPEDMEVTHFFSFSRPGP
jgi:hypothetical protein